MMSAPFFGRQEELHRLQRLLGKKTSSLVVIKGRRRIGKSRLILEFGRDLPLYLFTGLPPDPKTTAESQRVDFAKQLERQLGLRGLKTDDWGDLLWNLGKATETGRRVIVLDEINWIGFKDSTFLGKLKNAWDLILKNNPELLLILSGSMSAWIERNILGSTGFMGRTSLELTLDELPLGVCDEFWGPHKTQVSSYEKFKFLSVTGGVPRYLEEIDPALSAEENLAELAYKKGALLYEEFDRIFSDLFSTKQATYKRIVEHLVDGPGTLDSISQAMGVIKSGDVCEYLLDLVETGYIARDTTWNLKREAESNLSQYRLRDNYLRFYLKFIEPYANRIEQGLQVQPPAWHGIMGLQFENLVINNVRLLLEILNVDPKEVVSCGPFFQRKTQRQRGCQIDCLIQSRFGTLYVCEIKFRRHSIGTEVIEEVKEKVSRIQAPKHVSLRPVLIHVNGVNDAVMESGYFAHIVDFAGFMRNHL